ncbi:MAG TPA: B12-binding domain-containing radical SAM protein [Thermoanaerobacterales bacterium]|nr:B12-binding domain-containing radical SAM protein [Thermoanaerobacterales bacterium]
MKTLLVGINAKYIHTNLAIRNISAYCNDEDITIYEATINDSIDCILEDIISAEAQIVGFSCYLWNINDVLYLGENVKKIKPDTTIVLGGPEVSYEVEDLLKENYYIDYIILNEGEERFHKLLGFFKGEISLESIDGLAYRYKNNIVVNQPKEYVYLNKIPFSYTDDEENLNHKLVYYETSRGCVFRCAFCLSSLETQVRTANLEKVKEDLSKFTQLGVRVVKLVDRSFNCDLNRAIDLLDIIRQLPGNTVFHCEINPELVNDTFIKSLEGLENRLQFEVGVQSTKPETLREISRTPDVKRVLKGIEMLKTTGIKLHVDLIAGLPYETFDMFGYSFDDIYNQYPHEIQLGFLKLLKGTRLREKADKYGIVYRSKPPYQILYNKYITYSELCILSGIAQLLDKYYNTGRFNLSLAHLEKSFNRPFEMYLSFYYYCKERDIFRNKNSLKTRYDILYDFALSLGVDAKLFSDIVKFDFMLTSGKGALPDCIDMIEDRRFLKKAKEYIYNEKWIKSKLPQAFGLSSNELSKKLSYGLFNYDVPNNTNKKEKGIIFFDNYGEHYYAEFKIR